MAVDLKSTQALLSYICFLNIFNFTLFWSVWLILTISSDKIHFYGHWNLKLIIISCCHFVCTAHNPCVESNITHMKVHKVTWSELALMNQFPEAVQGWELRGAPWRHFDSRGCFVRTLPGDLQLSTSNHWEKGRGRGRNVAHIFAASVHVHVFHDEVFMEFARHTCTVWDFLWDFLLTKITPA